MKSVKNHWNLENKNFLQFEHYYLFFVLYSFRVVCIEDRMGFLQNNTNKPGWSGKKQNQCYEFSVNFFIISNFYTKCYIRGL